MWNRACPLCFVRVPRKMVLTRGDSGLSVVSCAAGGFASEPGAEVGGRVIGGILGADTHFFECQGDGFCSWRGALGVWVRCSASTFFFWRCGATAGSTA